LRGGVLSRLALWAVFVALIFVCPARAELRSLEILVREPFADGHTFGDTGPYERIIGIAHFAVDPDHPRNRHVVDLSLAPRNAEGKVEFDADVFILAPKDLSKG